MENSDLRIVKMEIKGTGTTANYNVDSEHGEVFDFMSVELLESLQEKVRDAILNKKYSEY